MLAAIYMADTVVRVRPVVNKWGEKTSDNLKALSARVQWATKMVTDRAGKQVVSQGSVMVHPMTEVRPEDKFRISGVDYPWVATKFTSDFSTKLLEIYL